jgi:hypothetical protein
MAISNSTAAQQNQLVADLVAAETAREGAVTGSIHENQSRSWRQFSKYLDFIGLSHDPYLESFTRSQWNKIIDYIQERLMAPWLQEQSEIPSRMYLRPSGKTADPTQPRTRIYSLASFYNDYSVPSKTKTQRKSNIKPSLPAPLPKSPSDNLRSNSAQSCNSQSVPSSLPCVRVSTSKSPNRKNNEQNRLPLEPSILQKWSTHRPQRPITRIC